MEASSLEMVTVTGLNECWNGFGWTASEMNAEWNGFVTFEQCACWEVRFETDSFEMVNVSELNVDWIRFVSFELCALWEAGLEEVSAGMVTGL